MKKAILVAVAGLMAAASLPARAADSVDVKFRYLNPPATPPVVVGDFQVPAAWTSTNPAYTMSNVIGLVWMKTVRLAIGGNPGGTLPGTWQYKFYYPGAGTWPNDPLNHHVNAADNGNTFIYAKDPTIYQILPNQRQPVQTTATPLLSAYIFPKVGASVDTSSLRLVVDGTTYPVPGADYAPTSGLLAYALPVPLANGTHTMIVRASSTSGGSNADTVTFYTQSGYVVITSQGGFGTLTSSRTLYGIVQGSGATQVRIVRNGTDTSTAAVTSGKFAATLGLLPGLNTFTAIADSAGVQVVSAPVSFTRIVSHRPNAQITFLDHGQIDIQAIYSTSPDTGRTLSYVWGQDPSNPAQVAGINGNTSSVITIDRPAVQGEYYFTLVATDTSGNSDTTRNFMTVGPTPPVVGASYATVPRWVREGRMYCMFFKMHTPAGTINAAIPDLNRIAAMGYNILWVLPVMKNRDPINNGPGPGYNIVDFYTVAPEYGTNQDMKNFIAAAHALGMHVILDITPNHTSSSHPFVLDARTFGTSSRYWTYYQHQVLGNGNLSQSMTADGFVYYNGFSDALLNWNWADPDARAYMIDVYKYWVNVIGADGFRFDVYWGPHSRANNGAGGETEMGIPVRTALKHIRPDIDLLGETAGTGGGTEVNYADQGGGLDQAYDWNLMGTVEQNIWLLDGASRINLIDASLRNGSVTQGMGYIPGPNASFLRFLENQDQDRIAYLYASGAPDSATARARTMPVATSVNLAVGLPQVYAGQEVGRGPGISDFDVRRRGVINWNDPGGGLLMPHYQKLAQIRKQYHCFSTQLMVRVPVDVPGVYAYTRPDTGPNGVVVANMDGAAHTAHVILSTAGSPQPLYGYGNGTLYVASDLYNGTTQGAVFSGGIDTLTVSLPAFGSAVFVIDNTAHTLTLPPLTSIGQGTGPAAPGAFALLQNYPNPFNPATTITYTLAAASDVMLRVYDVLGREVATLARGMHAPGTYSAVFDASRLASGIYFYRLQAGPYVSTRKMILAR